MTAEQLRRSGKPEDAADLCRDALARFPGHLSARVTLGWALLDMGRLKEAREEFETVRRSAPDNLVAIRGLAQLHVLEENEAYSFDVEPESEAGDGSGAPDPVGSTTARAAGGASPVVARLETWLSRVETLRAAV